MPYVHYTEVWEYSDREVQHMDIVILNWKGIIYMSVSDIHV